MIISDDNPDDNDILKKIFEVVFSHYAQLSEKENQLKFEENEMAIDLNALPSTALCKIKKYIKNCRAS
jgi:hypothetical protein